MAAGEELTAEANKVGDLVLRERDLECERKGSRDPLNMVSPPLPFLLIRNCSLARHMKWVQPTMV
jgi:hypothetical protein